MDKPAIDTMGEPPLMDRPAIYAMAVEELAASLKVAPEAIDPSRSFDEYGLDSVDAILATGSLGDRLGLELAPEFLIQHRTLDQAVDALMILIGLSQSADTADAPVFVIPGGGGRDGSMARLINRCYQAIHCEIMSLGKWQDWIEDGLDLDHIVERCVEVIELRCPEGPVRLSGYSQGGQVAFAVTLALIRKGRDVEILSLLDSSTEAAIPPVNWRYRVGWLFRGRRGIVIMAARLLHHRLRLPLPAKLISREISDADLITFSEVVQVFPTRFAHEMLRKAMMAQPAFLSDRNMATFDTILQMQFLDLLWKRWTKRTRDGWLLNSRVNLFRSSAEGAEDLGWRAFCPHLKIIDVEGDHKTMFDEPNLDRLAELFVGAVRSV